MVVLKKHDSGFLNSIFMIWLLIFLFTSIIALSVQLVILPLFLPEWHAGDGLLVGGDWVAFHREAIEVAQRIESQGWSAWELRPRGWMPAGVAGAVYAVTWPKPWTLIPLNAAVHATTFLIVMQLLLFFVTGVKTAFISSIPYAFFPSAMLWYTQIHRDGYQILGTMLFLYGFSIVAGINKNLWQDILKGLILSVTGVLVIWLVRPHSVVILQYMILLLIFFITVYYIILVLRKRINILNSVAKVTILLVVFIIAAQLAETEGASKYQSEFYSPDEVTNDTVTDGLVLEELYWEKLFWFPSAFDNQLYSVAYLRSVRYPGIYGETASGIDYDQSFHNAYDFFRYLPRAVQIAFLAPFPTDWFGEGKYAATTFFRRVSALEMIFIYLSIPLLLYAIWLWRKKIELWLIVIFCTVMMMPIVYSVPNVGTIYRYRYGYLMLLVGLAVAVFIEQINKVQAAKKCK